MHSALHCMCVYSDACNHSQRDPFLPCAQVRKRIPRRLRMTNPVATDRNHFRMFYFDVGEKKEATNGNSTAIGGLRAAFYGGCIVYGRTKFYMQTRKGGRFMNGRGFVRFVWHATARNAANFWSCCFYSSIFSALLLEWFDLNTIAFWDDVL